MTAADRRTTIPPAPSAWARASRTIRATWTHDPVARAFVIAALSLVGFLALMLTMLTWPSVMVPIVEAVAGLAVVCAVALAAQV